MFRVARAWTMQLADDKEGQSYEEKYDDGNFEANPPHLDGVPEMSSLIYLEAPNILHNLEVNSPAPFFFRGRT